MAPTKNVRKNYRVKSKKRPIPKNNKRKTSKSKKRPSRNKRRTRRKQKGGNNTTVIVRKKNPRGLFRTGSRKSNKIKRELPPTASPSISKPEGQNNDLFQEYPQNLLLEHMRNRKPSETALYINYRQAHPFLKGPGADSTLLSRQPSKLPMHSKHLRLIPAGPDAPYILTRQ